MSKDIQSRKWQMTINNPATFDHEKIKSELDKLKSIVYWCMADEIGNDEKTPHTHLYLIFSSSVRFSTLKKRFPKAHLERANGSNQENKDYIQKSGKWVDTDKAKTSIDGTFEEWGEMPMEANRCGGIEALIIEKIIDGASNAEILLEFPNYIRGLRDIDYVRQTLIAEEYKNTFRNLDTTYMWGATGTGKTRSTMEGFGYSNVYSVTNYKNPFDGYVSNEVLLFDEFISGISIQSMNQYLDGYPLRLPARYSDRQACYTKVVIISNVDLREQYPLVQKQEPEVWNAFLRRIHRVICFTADGRCYLYNNAKNYVDRKAKAIEIQSVQWSELEREAI